MNKKLYVIAGVLVATGAIGAAAAGALYYTYPVQVSTVAGLTRNYFPTLFAPSGTTTGEMNAAYQGAGTVRLASPAETPLRSATAGDWPSYNRTLAQRIAVAIGFTHPAWPTKITTAKIVVLGLDSACAPR